MVEDQHGSRIGGPKIIGSHAAGGEQVYWADLNADKREDFVIKTLVGGCGTIYTFSCNVTFVLSEGERYSITPTGGLWSGLRYLVDMNGDGICEFVHTTFVQGSHVKGRDGRGHNYWVYNILGIRRGGLVIKNSLAPQFAKWIWYTYKPNHQATTQITKTQKELLWKKYADQIFWKPSAKRSTKSR